MFFFNSLSGVCVCVYVCIFHLMVKKKNSSSSSSSQNIYFRSKPLSVKVVRSVLANVKSVCYKRLELVSPGCGPLK